MDIDDKALHVVDIDCTNNKQLTNQQQKQPQTKQEEDNNTNSDNKQNVYNDKDYDDIIKVKIIHHENTKKNEDNHTKVTSSFSATSTTTTANKNKNNTKSHVVETSSTPTSPISPPPSSSNRKICPHCNEEKSAFGYKRHLTACERRVHNNPSTMIIQEPPSKEKKKRGRKRKVEEEQTDPIITKSFNKQKMKKNMDKNDNEVKTDDNNHKSSIVKAIDNYILLHAALNDPARVMNEGVGLWMIEKLFQEYKLDMTFTENDIHQQWNSILGLMQKDDHDHIKNVLTIIFASRSPEAQCVALIAAGWTFVPREEDNQKSQRRRKNKAALAAIYQSGLWEYDGNALSLNEAWDEYVSEIEKDVNKEYENIKRKLQDMSKDIVIPQKKTKKSKPPPKTESKTPHTVDFPVEKTSVKNSKDNQKLNVFFSSKERPKSLKEITKKLLTVHELPAQNLTVYKRRLSYVKKGDPRPTLYCTWCGPKLPEGEELKEETICEPCMILFDKGWRYECESYMSRGKVMFNTKYINADGKVMDNAKSFLSSTSSLIVKALSTVTEDKKSDCIDNTDNNNNKSNEIEREEDSDEDGNDHNLTFHKMRQKQLPTYDEMIITEWGLCELLKEDELCLLNLCYGTDSTIAYLILEPLLTTLSSPFPSQIMNESEYTYFFKRF